MKDVFVYDVGHLGFVKEIDDCTENFWYCFMFRAESDHQFSEIFISQYAVLKESIHSLSNAVNDPVCSKLLFDNVLAGDAVHH